MAGSAVLKDNTRLFIWDDGSTVTNNDKVARVDSIGDIGGESEEIETTTIDSMAREFVAGFEDSGTIDLVLNVVENEYTTMKALQDSGANINWGISHFNRATGQQIIGIQGQGYINTCSLTGISVGGLIQVNSGIRISGAINQGFVDPIGYTSGVPVETITLTGMGGASTIDTNGGKLQIVADVAPANASNKGVTWTVEKGTGEATINSTGLLTAVANGTVTVKATAKDGSLVVGTLEVTISNQA